MPPKNSTIQAARARAEAARARPAESAIKKARMAATDVASRISMVQRASNVADEAQNAVDDFDDAASHSETVDTFLCVLYDKQRMGAAMYDTDSCTLRVASVQCAVYEVPLVVAQIKKQVVVERQNLDANAPIHACEVIKTIVVSSSERDDVKHELSLPQEVLSEHAPEAAGSTSAATAGTRPPAAPYDSGTISLHVMKAAAFSADIAHRLLNTVASHDGDAAGGTAARRDAAGATRDRIASVLDVHDSIMMRAAGGMLAYLLRNGIVNELEDDDSPIVLAGGVRMLPLQEYMYMDTASYRALSIFSTEAHPSLIKTTGTPREGFSLFALLDHTVTTAGRRLLRSYLMQPSLDVGLLNCRLDMVQFLHTLRSREPDMYENVKGALKKTKDVLRTLLRMKQAKAGPSDWAALQKTLVGVMDLRNHLSRYVQHGDVDAVFSAANPLILADMLGDFTDAAVELNRDIDAVIDWSATKATKRVCVNAHVDSKLDAYRAVYAAMPDELGNVAMLELQRYTTLQTLGVSYVPQLGCLIQLDMAANAHVMSVADDDDDAPNKSMVASWVPEDLEMAYETGDCMFFKNATMHELDEQYGDIMGAIADVEAACVRQLEQHVITHEDLISAIAAHLARLDVLCSFAEVSQNYGFTRPHLDENPIMLVKAATHPLQAIAVETFVANDIVLGQDQLKPMAIVTGANSSGKSVYLKTVGTIAFMAQIGCFVPAEYARLGCVDRLFTRIQSAESVTENQSTFAIDLNQMGIMLRHATPRSLLLIDEFGKGTASMDGAALLAASIRHILSQAVRSDKGALVPPRVVITTHFREVFDHDLLTTPDASGVALGDDAKDAFKHIGMYHMNVLLQRAAVTIGSGGATAAGDMHAEDAAPEWNDTVTPMFKLAAGRSASSYGVACANQAGLPVDVLHRASNVTQLLRHGHSVLPLESVQTHGGRRQRERRQLDVVAHLFSMAGALASADGSVPVPDTTLRELLARLTVSV